MSGIKDKVAIIGMGCSRFGERFEASREDLILEAVQEALDDAGLTLQDIDAFCFGSFYKVKNFLRKIIFILTEKNDKAYETNSLFRYAHKYRHAKCPFTGSTACEYSLDTYQAFSHYILQRQQPKAGKVTVTNIPLKVPDMQDIPLRPAPEIGQHTQEVLQELLGLDECALKNLEQKGII